MTEPAILKAALDCAARGWQAFPLKPQAKEPATWRGFYNATTNPATLHRWFANGFPYNLAVRMGEASGVWVLDVDGHFGFRNLAWLEREHGRLPSTLISFTSNGCHFWFLTNGTSIPSCIGKIAAGIDVRADGSYVAAPPSVHPDGPIYRWSNHGVPPVPAPEWLIHLAQRKPSLPTRVPDGTTASRGAVDFPARATAESSAAYGQGRDMARNCREYQGVTEWMRTSNPRTIRQFRQGLPR